MISFIIPTYNYVCVQLAADLTEQAEALHRQMPQAFDYEVLVGDDASTDKATVVANRAINNLPHARLIEMEHNMGRAFLLNRLMEEARFDHVVMIDSDAAVCTPDFVSRYWHAREEASVLCGTLRNPDTPVQPGCELRYKYEHAATTLRQQQAEENLSPYFRLSTFNLMLDKRALGDLRFDSRCEEYGYEDALLGLELQRQGVTLLHIDNPLIHTGIDSNASFLSKTEAAMRTLSHLDGLMQEQAGPSRYYRRLQAVGLSRPAAWCFRLLRPLLRSNLLSHHPSLLIFQLYKLGYYASLK